MSKPSGGPTHFKGSNSTSTLTLFHISSLTVLIQSQTDLQNSSPLHPTARNLFYLRISPRTVLMCTVLLDQRHVNWMTDETFQRILQVLKPRLLNKLKSETNPLSGPSDASQKKTKMDVHRGTGFQMGYYFR